MGAYYVDCVPGQENTYPPKDGLYVAVETNAGLPRVIVRWDAAQIGGKGAWVIANTNTTVNESDMVLWEKRVSGNVNYTAVAALNATLTTS